MNNPELKQLRISNIELLDNNPRLITDDDLQKLAKDIKDDPAFILQRPPLINAIPTNGPEQFRYVCYAGTQRIKASVINGEESIMCFVEVDVPEDIQNKRMLVDNLHRGRWDEQKLLELNIELDIMKDFGFNDFEVSIFNDVVEPTLLTAEMKDAPPTMKLTFESIKQLETFEIKLKDIIKMNPQFETVTYSVSAGEI